MAETDEEGRITRAYGFNPHTQQARTNEEDEDAQEGSLWSTDPIWQADLAAGQSLKEASYHYLVTDHLGTPVLALNKAGETTWKANYEAFGKAIINPASTAQINLRLPGQYFDAETGLHQNWNRDYAPGIGRYVQADPIGLAGGENRYVYVNGNPLPKIDSEGLQAIAVPMPGPAIPPAALIIGACIANPACAARLAGLAGYGIGTAIYPYIEPPLSSFIDQCATLPVCEPSVGTVCFMIDIVLPSKPHYPIEGSHYHLFIMNQAPNGNCFWNKSGASRTTPQARYRALLGAQGDKGEQE
nr:RHS repeat-associated core domain-containing protein [uncultured Ottowia sp.]